MRVPISHSLESLSGFLRYIKSHEPPTIVDAAYIRKAGFTTNNDLELRGIAAGLGLINAEGQPTRRWLQYRDPEFSEDALQDAVSHAFYELFEDFTMNDIESPESKKPIINWLVEKEGLSLGTAIRAERMFRHLCLECGFIGQNPIALDRPSLPLESALPSLEPIHQAFRSNNIPRSINLPLTRDIEVYRNIFRALKESEEEE